MADLWVTLAICGYFVGGTRPLYSLTILAVIQNLRGRPVFLLWVLTSRMFLADFPAQWCGCVDCPGQRGLGPDVSRLVGLPGH